MKLIVGITNAIIVYLLFGGITANLSMVAYRKVIKYAKDKPGYENITQTYEEIINIIKGNTLKILLAFLTKWPTFAAYLIIITIGLVLCKSETNQNK